MSDVVRLVLRCHRWKQRRIGRPRPSSSSADGSGTIPSAPVSSRSSRHCSRGARRWPCSRQGPARASATSCLAVLLDGLTVVVSPLIALMKNQIDALVGQGIGAARLDSSLGPDETRDVSQRLRDGGVKLLYVAPERFNNERFVAQLERTRIALFAVDEAHCISEWGHNFRPDYLKLATYARELGAERVLALTATATARRRGRHLRRLRNRVRRRRRHRLLPTEPDPAHDTRRRGRTRRAARRPAARAAAGHDDRLRHAAARGGTRRGAPRRSRAAGACVPRRDQRRGEDGGPGLVDRVGPQHRRGDDRLRDGHRQGRRPLRVPPEPAEGARVVLAGDRARGPRRGSQASASCSPAATTYRRSRTSPTATRRRGT